MCSNSLDSFLFFFFGFPGHGECNSESISIICCSWLWRPLKIPCRHTEDLARRWAETEHGQHGPSVCSRGTCLRCRLRRQGGSINVTSYIFVVCLFFLLHKHERGKRRARDGRNECHVHPFPLLWSQSFFQVPIFCSSFVWSPICPCLLEKGTLGRLSFASLLYCSFRATSNLRQMPSSQTLLLHIEIKRMSLYLMGKNLKYYSHMLPPSKKQVILGFKICSKNKLFYPPFSICMCIQQFSAKYS